MARSQEPAPSDLSESELAQMKVDDLRQVAKEAGVKHVWDMHKEDLVREVAQARGRNSGSGSGGTDEEGGSTLRTGDETSRSLQYSQEVTSPEEDPERPGRSLATTNHDVIRQWAEDRGGTPATVEGTEHGSHLGVLRFDFGGDNENLRHVSWEEWFDTFDTRKLNFLYQEQRKDGSQSNFFRLESPDREDA